MADLTYNMYDTFGSLKLKTRSKFLIPTFEFLDN